MDTSTNMTDEWIASVVAKNPIVLLESGNYRTCPVRLSFPNIFSRSKPIPPNPEGKFGANLLFPVCADLTLLKKVVEQVAKDKWGDKPPKLRSPFKDQEENLRYEGYVAGGIFLACNAHLKPSCIDAKGHVITDETAVYPGVWAVCTIRPFSYDKGVNKGVAFGLQSVMIVADDKNLGGSSEDVGKAFAGVQIDAGGVDTSSLFA